MAKHPFHNRLYKTDFVNGEICQAADNMCARVLFVVMFSFQSSINIPLCYIQNITPDIYVDIKDRRQTTHQYNFSSVKRACGLLHGARGIIEPWLVKCTSCIFVILVENSFFPLVKLKENHERGTAKLNLI